MRSGGNVCIREQKTSGSENKDPKYHVGNSAGSLTIVSLGPGDPQYLVPKARQALVDAEVVVGYKTYIDLVDPELLEGKETISNGMKAEIKRCSMAVQKALEGKNVAVVCSGDAGIYGMAGLVFDILKERKLLEDVKVKVIPGIPALAAAASLLGAPLMHDFAVISLSDLMTPWEDIKARVEAASKADFVIVLYNPKSKKRNWQLKEALNIIRNYRTGETPVGIVRNAARKDESVCITTISEVNLSEVDMMSIIIAGNSKTWAYQNNMVTPRGYVEKYGVD
ncbi:MAG: precorrin-3B C(17)-methyltransferase [Proteobacteria bacterium]|nr:precorrin-3B C(17)-methyltransferase [Pseudomonadota bacterium]MBU4009214.1 precorrin-3B C(17)-methyltransferase [Pseudomonadota bacterium]MBU4035286.1 precorrin-3B C(17)-methyltransferase [Pseudomonadota bacterium]